VVSVFGYHLVQTENSGFCAQIVYTVDLLSFSRKNKMKGRRSEVHIRDPGNTRMGGERAEGREEWRRLLRKTRA